MMRTANLLPWRQRQQRRCLRFWAGMFTGSLLVALMLCATSRVSDALVTRASVLRHASDVALRQGLEQRQSSGRRYRPNTSNSSGGCATKPGRKPGNRH